MRTHVCGGCRRSALMTDERHARSRGCIGLSWSGKMSVIYKEAISRIELEDVLLLCNQARHTLSARAEDQSPISA